MQHEYEFKGKKQVRWKGAFQLLPSYPREWTAFQMILSAFSKNNEICSSQGKKTHTAETHMRSIGGPREQANNLHWEIALQSRCPHWNIELALEGLLANVEAGFSRCPEADKPAELNRLPVGAPTPLCPEAVLLYFFSTILVCKDMSVFSNLFLPLSWPQGWGGDWGVGEEANCFRESFQQTLIFFKGLRLLIICL